MEYYTHEKLSKHLYRITDRTGVCCYLVVGERKACLLDTCSGLGNLKECVESITRLPVDVILTHGHLDHIGGAGLFDSVYMNHEDLPVYKEHGDMEFRVRDTNIITGLELKKEDLVETYTGEILDINDGDIFDLGGLNVKMIGVRGHTPGMMCPMILEEETVIFGDACGVSVLLFDKYSSNVSEYKDSLLNLKNYEDQYDVIYRNHGSFFSHKSLLDNVIECCDLILAGEDDKYPVSIHGFDLQACHKVTGHQRADGLEGNIFYLPSKAI